MKRALLILFTSLFIFSASGKGGHSLLKLSNQDDSEPIFSKGGFLSVGFGNRLNQPSDRLHKLTYVNNSYQGNDTFRYTGDLKSASHLVNLQLSAGINGRYGGVRWDIGFVPFANRNATHTLSVFGILPINEKIFIEPFAGYSRFRKMRKIGTMTGKNGNIMFENDLFNQISLRVIQVQHQYMFGFGVNYKINETTFIRFDVRHNTTFDTRLKMNVRGYKDDNTSSFLESVLFPKRSRNFKETSGYVDFRDRFNKPLDHFFSLRSLSFNAQVVFRLN